MNERLRPEQVTFYHENGFLGPIDLLSQEEVAEVRRHVEEVEAKLGAKMMSHSASRRTSHSRSFAISSPIQSFLTRSRT